MPCRSTVTRRAKPVLRKAKGAKRASGKSRENSCASGEEKVEKRTSDDGNGSGLLPQFAGRGMSVWNTLEEAEASWKVPSVMDGIERTK
jgi:hypothetical protein